MYETMNGPELWREVGELQRRAARTESTVENIKKEISEGEYQRKWSSMIFTFTLGLIFGSLFHTIRNMNIEITELKAQIQELKQP